MKKNITLESPPELDPEKAIHSQASWTRDLVYGMSERFDVPPSFIIPCLLTGIGCTVSRKVRFAIGDEQTNTSLYWALSIPSKGLGSAAAAYMISLAAGGAVGQEENIKFHMNFDTTGASLDAMKKCKNPSVSESLFESWSMTDSVFPAVHAGTRIKLGKLRKYIYCGYGFVKRTNILLTENHRPVIHEGSLDALDRNIIALREVLDRNLRLTGHLVATEEAEALFRDCRVGHARTSEGLSSPHFRDWYNMFPVLISRIAGLLTCLEYDSPTCISAEAIHSANYLFGILATHQRLFLESGY